MALRLATRTLARPTPLTSAAVRASFVASRGLTSSAIAREPPPVENPSHAGINENIIGEYPDIEDRSRKHGLGHSTTGSGVGRHSDRTLASLSMSGKVCVCTGAARGLGNLFARTFVESGCNQLVVIDLDQIQAQDAANEIVEWFVNHGEAKTGEIEAIGLGCDVSVEQNVIDVFKTVKDHFGRIDVLATSAGICENIPAVDYTGEKLKKLMGINVDGSFYCAREAAKMMIEQESGGAITLVGSMSGTVVNVPQPQTPYNFSKAAVKHMASSLAVEWAKYGIRVNCLSPGYMATSLTKTILDRNPALRETWENLTPVGRVGDPEDLKGAIIYLSSDAATFTTGIDLRVDGGYCLT